MHVIDIASTEQHLWRALDVLSHVAYSGGSVLFVNNRAGYGHIVQVRGIKIIVYFVLYSV